MLDALSRNLTNRHARLTTGRGFRFPGFQTIVDATCAPGRRRVLYIGGQCTAGEVGSVAANRSVVNSAPPVEILERVALWITHARFDQCASSVLS